MTTSPEPRARRAISTPLVELGLGAAWLLGIAAALQILDRFVGQNPMALAIGGAVIAELGCSRAGVTWSSASPSTEPPPPAITPIGAARGALTGAVPSLIAAAATLALGVALGWARVGVGHPSLTLFFGVLRAVAVGVRDELLYRGLPLVASRRAGVPLFAARIFGALAGAVSIALVPGATLGAVALTFASGLLFALVWARGAFAAVSAHAAWALLIGPVLHGAAIDATWSAGTLTMGPRADGRPSYLAAGVLVAVAIGCARWLHAKPESPRES